ncbi:MAG: hypothetical protein AAF598_10405 [Bacteroidota bacterium]
MKNGILFVFTLLLFSCDSSKTNYGESFIGTWESNDHLKIKLEIKEQVREGKVIEARYELQILEGKEEMPPYYLQEGQYNYQLVTAKPKFNQHPFMEFIHKNSFADTIPYLGLDESRNTLIRRYRVKGIPEITFKRVD